LRAAKSKHYKTLIRGSINELHSEWEVCIVLSS